jgi:hypothetical protein
MAHNRYFIIDAADPNKDAIMQYVAQTNDKQRCNIAETKIVIKLHNGDHSNHAELAGYEEYTHHQILEELNNSEWTVPFDEI